MRLCTRDLGTQWTRSFASVGKGLVHQERARLADDRPTHRHTLSWPPDSWAGLRLSHSVSPRMSAASLTRLLISDLDTFCIRKGNPMFSATFMCG